MKPSIDHLRSWLRRLGVDVVRVHGDQTGLPDVSSADRALYERVKPFTATSAERVHATVMATRYLVEHEIAGAIVECGVWRGGSVIAMAMTLLEAGIRDRDLFLFDTFAGMTEPGDEDRTGDGTRAVDILRATPRGTGPWAEASIDEVRANVEATGYPRPRLHFVKGRVEETLPAAAPEEIALLRLDTDWYESTRHSLEHLFPRLVRRGVLIVDDYGHWQGARKATDEYFRSRHECILLNRIDYTGRIAVKS